MNEATAIDPGIYQGKKHPFGFMNATERLIDKFDERLRGKLEIKPISGYDSILTAQFRSQQNLINRRVSTAIFEYLNPRASNLLNADDPQGTEYLDETIKDNIDTLNELSSYDSKLPIQRISKWVRATVALKILDLRTTYQDLQSTLELEACKVLKDFDSTYWEDNNLGSKFDLIKNKDRQQILSFLQEDYYLAN